MLMDTLQHSFGSTAQLALLHIYIYIRRGSSRCGKPFFAVEIQEDSQRYGTQRQHLAYRQPSPSISNPSDFRPPFRTIPTVDLQHINSSMTPNSRASKLSFPPPFRLRARCFCVFQSVPTRDWRTSLNTHCHFPQITSDRARDDL